LSISTYLPFLLLLTAVFGLWMHRAIWIAALIAAIGAGYFSGALHGLAAVWIALLAVLAMVYSRARAASSGKPLAVTLAGCAFFLYALAMGLALLPGFTRVVLVDAATLSPGAMPYDIAVGFPKVVIGIVILGLINRPLVRSWRELGRVLLRAAPIFVVTAIAGMTTVVLMGYTNLAPKWTPLFLLWAPINLFFTCLTEEAFFRGFVQQEVSRPGPGIVRSPLIALAIGAVLFGAAHFAGGRTYVLAATIAGLGYGWAYLRTQRIEASMAVHFGVNAVHFLLFAYPRLG
jgi:membrane protease YdiL (CAAX protease family)